ncbi:glutamine--fructose-6-phosphate transaminase (isomerizing) [bacterium]|nr:glutamine--fructose-6-phosphate transaminase (isomerizing) [bacterium]
MCGIVGYIGNKQILPVLLNGLKRLEYRGYDSAGIAVISNNELWLRKKQGKIKELEKEIGNETPEGSIGIAHTRWATHGAPSTLNAHPHTDCTGTITLVHNGIVENFSQLKKSLEEKGHVFKTDTDTEVLAHLIEMLYDGDLAKATQKALHLVEGTFGLLVISTREPDKMIAARRGSPLVLGVGNGETFVASDGTAIVEHTRDVIFLEDDELAIIDRNGYQIRTISSDNAIVRSIEKLPFDMTHIQKSGFPHFMIKEINEQPQTVRDTMRGRLLTDEGSARLGGLDCCWEKLRKSKRFILTGCGTSWHAALIGEYLIEQLANVPVEVEYASEFRYRDPILQSGDTVLAITQSGETLDTLAALREAKRKGALSLGLCNVVGSTIARESDAGVYSHAGPEIGVASTKAFTSQVISLALIALSLGRMKRLSAEEGIEIVNALKKLPDKIEEVINQDSKIKQIAEYFVNHSNALYLGRGLNYPVALEGALKMKEISYIHAEGYPAAEMKHGPIALIDENMPVVFIAVQDSIYDKIISNIEEVKARGGKVIAIVTKGDKRVSEKVDYTVEIPETLHYLTPVLTVIPLQLLAYHTAVLKGCDVDQPRNLAKSVTVE